MRTFLGTLLLRVGVAFALLYPAVMSFISPEKWVSHLPPIVSTFMAPKTFLMLLAAYELLFAIIILIKPDPGWIAGIVFLTFTLTAAFTYTDFDSVYQNITMGLAALSLAFLGKIRG